jgi:hypothetical protein
MDEGLLLQAALSLKLEDLARLVGVDRPIPFEEWYRRSPILPFDGENLGGVTVQPVVQKTGDSSVKRRKSWRRGGTAGGTEVRCSHRSRR